MTVPCGHGAWEYASIISAEVAWKRRAPPVVPAAVDERSNPRPVIELRGIQIRAVKASVRWGEWRSDERRAKDRGGCNVVAKKTGV
jgi:hypothetical protein